MDQSNVGMLFQLVKNPFEKMLSQAKPFVVFLLRNDSILFGWISLHNIDSNSAELGVVMLKPSGLSRVTKFISKVLEIAFTNLKVRQVFAETTPTNTRAIWLLKGGSNKRGCGFTELPEANGKIRYVLNIDDFMGE